MKVAFKLCTLSPDIGHLCYLLNLIVAANQISSHILPEISQISGLWLINLSNNIFNETFPPQLLSLKYLEVLDVYNNNMTDDLPLGIHQMPNLRRLHLGGNFFSSIIPPKYSLVYLVKIGLSVRYSMIKMKWRREMAMNKKFCTTISQVVVEDDKAQILEVKDLVEEMNECKTCFDLIDNP
ncbi:hypothetical protein LguiB_001240 [Lonicera macranthoides]